MFRRLLMIFRVVFGIGVFTLGVGVPLARAQGCPTAKFVEDLT